MLRALLPKLHALGIKPLCSMDFFASLYRKKKKKKKKNLPLIAAYAPRCPGCQPGMDREVIRMILISQRWMGGLDDR
jgi:hypothetical protein